MAGGMPISTQVLATGYLEGRKLIYPMILITSLFFLWGFSYGLLDVLNKHFQTVLDITRLESTGLQVVYFGGGYLCFSPIAAEVLKRRGYKLTILMGLALYSLGAIMFWPTAKFSSKEHATASFGGFIACTFVIACGLATLETSANSYAVVIGNPVTANARLQFAQSFNGIASFSGPLIASKYFFTGENVNSLTNVQFVYLAVACAGIAVAILFAFSKLPEVSEAAIEADQSTEATQDVGPLRKQYNMIFGFIAQFSYVGAQVTCATFFINYATEAATFSSAEAARMLSYALITFTVGRFIATAIATVLSSSFILMVYAVCAIVFNIVVVAGHGTAGVGCLIAIFFFMAPMYPTIFYMGTQGLGKHTRRGAGILVMGVSGGAVYAPVQGAIADSIGTKTSYFVPLVGFCVVLAYSAYHWVHHGMQILKPKAVTAAAVETFGDVTIISEKKNSVVQIEEKRF